MVLGSIAVKCVNINDKRALVPAPDYHLGRQSHRIEKTIPTSTVTLGVMRRGTGRHENPLEAPIHEIESSLEGEPGGADSGPIRTGRDHAVVGIDPTGSTHGPFPNAIDVGRVVHPPEHTQGFAFIGEWACRFHRPPVVGRLGECSKYVPNSLRSLRVACGWVVEETVRMGAYSQNTRLHGRRCCCGHRVIILP